MLSVLHVLMEFSSLLTFLFPCILENRCSRARDNSSLKGSERQMSYAGSQLLRPCNRQTFLCVPS